MIGSTLFGEKSYVLGVGTDLIRQQRIEQVLGRQGERFVRRILTPMEIDLFRSHRAPVNYLAKAFAAKEALSKALGTGIAQGVSFQDFAIVRDKAGKPEVITFGKAREMVDACHGRLLISLADEGDLIQAFAVLSSCS
ncbi:MAG: holo-ACP synthase [Thalassolituus sp.]